MNPGMLREITRGISPKREPIVATGMENILTKKLMIRIAINDPGILLNNLPDRRIIPMVTAVIARAVGFYTGQGAPISLPFQKKLTRNFFKWKSQGIFDLGGKNNQSYTACKTYNKRMGYEFQKFTQFQNSEKYENYTRHQGRIEKSLVTFELDDF